MTIEVVSVVAVRKTSDGRGIEFWSDGCMTQTRLGFYIEGIGRKKLSVSAMWVVAGEIELYDLKELPKLFEAARTLAKKNPNFLPGDLRAAVGKVPSLRA